MTDKERLAKLNKAVASLKQTTEGYNPTGVHWRLAMGLINDVRADLKTQVLALGPIVAGGVSVLLHDLTHATAGVPGFPAFDDGFGDVGRAVIAPENCVVYKDSSAQGGDAFYLQGVSKIQYWVGHVAYAPPVGKRFAKGDKLGTIARIPASDGGPHVHLGINASPLIGYTLIHHTDYTHGAPLVGVQLKRALDN